MARKSRAGATYQNRQRRRAAQDLSAYKALVASPADLGSAAAEAALDGFTLLANAEVAVSIDAATDPGDITVAVDDRSLGIAGGGAGQLFRLGWLERGKELTINRGVSGPAGTVELHVLDEWGRKRTVASGTFT